MDMIRKRSLERGVKNFIVESPPDVRPINYVLVKNSVLALQELAAYHRKKFTFPMVGITGSNGKTIVKEWCSTLLSEKFNVAKSPQSYNSQIGVPLSLLQFQSFHEVGVFEVGISQTGEMKNIAEILIPTVGVF